MTFFWLKNHDLAHLSCSRPSWIGMGQEITPATPNRTVETLTKKKKNRGNNNSKKNVNFFLVKKKIIIYSICPTPLTNNDLTTSRLF